MNVTPEHEEEFAAGHPALSAGINRCLAEAAKEDGVYLKDITPGMRLLVATMNTHYFIERKEDGSLEIWGNQKYCPAPVKCEISGSTWGGSLLKSGFIGRNMCLEFSTVDHPKTITTSFIQEIIEL